MLGGGQPPAAVKAVVQVLWHQLLQGAPTQAKVLDRPGKLAGGGGQRQHLSDDLEGLAALAVYVVGARLDLPDDLSVGASAKAVLLAKAHAGGSLAIAKAEPTKWAGP